MDKFQKALNYLTQHRKVLGYSTMSLLTVGIEQIFSSVVFECPCNSAFGNMLYGFSFLLAPAFILLLLGYMVNARTWLLVTGKCSQERNLQGSDGKACPSLCQFLQMTAKASTAPLTWIAAALLEGNFYECAASGTKLAGDSCKQDRTACQTQLIKMPCGKKLSANITSEQLSLQAQSQLFGWFLIATMMTVVLTSACFIRCHSQVSYLQLKFMKIYLKTEHQVIDTKAKEHAKKLAEVNTNSFFVATDPAPLRIPSKEDWQKISSLYTFDPQGWYDNMIKYLNTNRGNSAEFQEESQDNAG